MSQEDVSRIEAEPQDRPPRRGTPSARTQPLEERVDPPYLGFPPLLGLILSMSMPLTVNSTA